MNTNKNTRGQLLHELTELRQKVVELKRNVIREQNETASYTQSLEFYKNVINSLDDLIFVKNERHEWVFLNDAACKFWGYRREDLLGKTDRDIFPQDEADVYWEKDNEVLRTGIPDLNIEKQTIGGEPYTIATKKSIYKDPHTGESYIVGTIRDITEQKKVEEAIRREKDKAQQYLDIAGVMLVALDNQGTVNLINRKGCQILGYEQEHEVLGKNWFDHFIPEDMRDETRKVFNDLMWGDSSNRQYYENAVLTKGGGKRMVAWHNTPLNDGEGNVIGTLSSGEDITENRQLEEQLFQSQKMEAIGRLAGGIAHDFNNLLTAIIGYTDIIARDSDIKEKHRSYVEEIKKSAERAATLTQQLLAFSRKQIMQPKVININTMLKNTKNMLQRMIGEDIAFTLTLGDPIGMIKVDPGKIEQVIINLAVNARDAMPNGGTLEIETMNTSLDRAYCDIHKGSRPGDYVLLSVHDSGKGIDEETMKHIFEPFFTTKEIGKGTGLGLATVYGIVRQSGGYIDIQSRESRGTTVAIYLPRVDEIPRTIEKTELSAAKGKNETILFVEDDDMVRNMVTAVLKQYGYHVIEAENGAVAVQLCEQEEKIHLMITDVVMPGTSGPELVKQISSIQPDMKVLYVSGYTDEAIVHHGVLDENTPFLQKPFTPQKLALKVQELLQDN
jgi:PAS domain S-box-containing protein